MKKTNWMQLPLLIITLSFFNACKPSGSSSVKAIVGDDNGKEKAIAIVGMRNSVEFTKIDVSTYDGKQLLESIYETYFGLVQCDASVVGGKKIAADSWMNLTEYYSFAGLLYLDKDRRLLVYNEDGGKKSAQYLPCGVVSAQLLTAPMLLSAAAVMDQFPLSQTVPSGLESKYKDKYLLVQSIYLALRGPHSDVKGNPLSLIASTVSMASQSYPGISVTDNGLAKSMVSADPYYNPCSRLTVNDRPYLQKWRLENYDCVNSSSTAGIKNFRPSTKLGFGNVRTKLQSEFTSLSLALGADAGNSPIEQARRVLRSTKPWNKITGVDAALASAFYQGSSRTVDPSSSFALSSASSDDAGFSLPSNGAASDQAEFGMVDRASVSFALAGEDTSAAEQSLQPIVRNLIRLFEGSSFSPYHPNFMSNPEGFATVIPQDTSKAQAMVKEFRSAEGALLWDYGQKMSGTKSESEQERLFQEYREKAGQMEMGWLRGAKAIVLDPKTYSDNSGLSSVNSADGGFTFRRGESIGGNPGSTRVYSNLGPTKVGDVSYHMYRDLTSPKDNGGFTVDRQLFRDAANPNIGGQVLKTSNMTITSGWQAQSPGGNVGHFVQSSQDRVRNQQQIDQLISTQGAQVKAGTQQGSNWRNALQSGQAWLGTVGAMSELNGAGRMITQGGDDMFGTKSKNMASLGDQRQKAWDQATTQAKQAVGDGVQWARNAVGGIFKSSSSSRPANSSSTPVIMANPPVLTTSGASSPTVRPSTSSYPTTSISPQRPSSATNTSGASMSIPRPTPITSGSGR